MAVRLHSSRLPADHFRVISDGKAQTVARDTASVCRRLTTEGTLVVSAGTEISPMWLQKFRNFARLSGIRAPIQVRRV